MSDFFWFLFSPSAVILAPLIAALWLWRRPGSIARSPFPHRERHRVQRATWLYGD